MRLVRRSCVFTKCNPLPDPGNFSAQGVSVGLSDRSPISLEEADILRDAQKGNREAQAALVDRYWDRLYRWLYQLTRDRHLAEDLTQESFLKALSALNNFRVDTRFTPWLFRIGYNTFVNHWRKSRSKEALPDYLESAVMDPAQQLLDQEARELLRESIDALPKDWRAALLLRIEEEMSFKQIAEALQTTEETARWRVFKARQKLLHSVAARQEQEKT